MTQPVADRLTAAGWRVTYDELTHVPPGPYGPGDVDHLQEDLLQADDGAGRILDVGWYPAEDLAGSFVVLVVVDHEWERPVVRRSARTVVELEALVEDVLAASG